jgi:hypothetical protein
MATNGMSDLDSLRQTIVAQRQFAGCLSDRGAVLYGNASQQATVTQIQILGGPNTASSVYQDVGNEGVLEQAAQIGIQRVPSLHYNGSILSGVNQISQISQFTGCQLSTQ